MEETKTRKQLRRCAICQKVGHNRSTCPVALLERAQPAKAAGVVPAGSAAPLKFFVHHVSTTPKSSPHVVDLKNNISDPWSKVEAAAPSSKTSLYHFHGAESNAKIFVTPKTLAEKKLPEPNYFKQTPRASEPLVPRASFNLFSKLSANLRAFIFAFKNSLPSYKLRPADWLATIRPLGLTAVLAILLVLLPAGARGYYQNLTTTANAIALNGTAGFMALQDSTSALLHADFNKANASTEMAVEKFAVATDLLENKHKILHAIIGAMPGVSGGLLSREKLVLAGQEISVGNSFLLQGLSQSQAVSTTLAGRLNIVLSALKTALPNYNQALFNINAVEASALPLQYQAAFIDFRKLFNKAINDFITVADVGDSLGELLGGQGLRRYLVVFQNPDELRATGGFVGSFAVVDVMDGEIAKLDVPAGGSYDLQGQLDSFLNPPTPLLLANKRWEFQDGNWFPDWSASAQKLMWFYRHSRNITVDGVVAINSSVLPRMLAIAGPLTDIARDLTLTSSTAITYIQATVENGPDKLINKPKQIISDLAPQFLTALKSLPPSATWPLLTNLSQALEQKEIQIYVTDEVAEARLAALGWGGKILPTSANQDYLMVINTNIQGEKSDAKIKQSISHEANVQPDGTVIDTVVVTREHTGNAAEKLYGQTNIDYLRLYVPAGSVLITASGFSWPDDSAFKTPNSLNKPDDFLNAMEQEVQIDQRSGTRITSEFGKYAFGNWVITEPGQVSRLIFTYRLPFKVFVTPTGDASLNFAKNMIGQTTKSSYQLVVQRQSGSNSSFESNIIYPDGWRPRWQDGADLKLASNGASIDYRPLVKDSIWSLLMEQR